MAVRTLLSPSASVIPADADRKFVLGAIGRATIRTAVVALEAAAEFEDGALLVAQSIRVCGDRRERPANEGRKSKKCCNVGLHSRFSASGAGRHQ